MTLNKLLNQADKLVDLSTDYIDRFYQVLKPQYIFYGLLALHWFSTSGSVYNMINNVPPYGEKAGSLEIISKEGSQQYSFEGSFAGCMTVLASCAFILAIRLTHQRPNEPKQYFMWYTIGCLSCAIILKMYRYKRG
ncbi:OST3 / OST6 family, transporter family protein [Spironucleus salmonicida]|uniref:OST3 / OST6 family, transporter family protein n=1 Tax=Spironucleus salmonicida TaxID=348837 RepID=V6LN92_9EUKA|nr:OST3 / OST6 family, transporter family protein [Spironucleus salmonicida]|eukprot:EST46105.1 Transmembrane domain-containing protein [Spironucleus salmonicida]